VIDVGATGQLERLSQAVADGEQLELDYYSFARDEMTTRVVDPIRVFHSLGAWYLAAYCHQAEGERLFRVDRVRALRTTGEPADPHPGAAADDDVTDLVYRPDPKDPRVQLRLRPEATWVAESVPTEETRARAGGGWDVVLAVSGAAFLERLLMRLGPAATVVSPVSARRARADAARRLLARYEP
jgi:proteasome accessory factor C